MPSNLLKKAFSSDGEITKEEIADILFVVKQVISLILGVALAMTSLQGTTAILAYTALSFLVCYVYVMKFLQPEEDTIETVDIFK